MTHSFIKCIRKKWYHTASPPCLSYSSATYFEIISGVHDIGKR